MKIKAALLAAAGVICSTTAFTLATPAQAQGSDMYLGQLMLVPYNFCPRSWLAANGQILAISSNTALFSLLGTTYGGNGTTTFALPDLRGRVPNSVGQGPGLSNYSLGQIGGTETVTLTSLQMPIHTHVATMAASSQAPNSGVPQGSLLGTFPVAEKHYVRGQAADRTMLAGSVQNSTAGGSQPFSVANPYLTLQWCISTQGIFPSRS